MFTDFYIFFHLPLKVLAEALPQRDAAAECGGLVPQRELNGSNVMVLWMVFRCHNILRTNIPNYIQQICISVA